MRLISQSTFNTKKRTLLLAGILLIAANLRISITSVGPLIDFIRDDTGISNGVAGLLTTLPLLGFAILSMFAPALARQFGPARTLLYSLVLLAIGILMRSVFSITGMLLGTFILGLAIAVGNVLLPSLIKERFPLKVGLMTGLYTTSMNLFGSIGAGASVPLAENLGWRTTLGLTAILAVIAIIVWLPQIRSRSQYPAEKDEKNSEKVSLWKSPLAWKVTLFMGTQSLIFYVILTWLPNMLSDQGLSASSAGFMLALLQFVSIPASFLVPLFAERTRDQRRLVTVIILIPLIGIIGILSGATELAALWAILLGLGMGGCLSISLTFMAMRAPDPEHASVLSGMAQSTGYLLAAIGPILFGWLRDASASWVLPLGALIVFCAFLFIVGMGAGRPAYVRSKKTNTE